MKKLTKTGIIIIVAVAVVVSVLGFLEGYKDATDRSDLINEVLEANCDCEEVNQIIYAKGLQFGNDGMSTEKAEYQLVNCDYESFVSESIRINKILNKKIKGFNDFDLLIIEMNNKTNREILTIKNGVIQ
ncbi:hypothetical protein EGM88_11835 [Aureibaculum marinum]|uniref:Uncharacterized protein n=1 Tax=Aureibaculum marinum TaxID=2487930 RepID=A0A3N4NE47_9FLAO|nr:hypothetical protein [Aureibaculum marinum]RPD94594.1 hypothetical protein EGM88_11835 [Aureibaculum marinum]